MSEENGAPISGATLRGARVSAGIGLREFARRTHWSAAYLSQIERGLRPVTGDIAQTYAATLGTDARALTPPPGDPLRIAHEWLVADSPMVEHSAAGRRVGSGLADELERRVMKLRRLDDVMGGTALHPIVRSDLEAARTVVLEGQHTPQVRRRLLRVVGELSQLAGWVYADAGHYPQARQTYLDGVSAANEAGDRPLAGQLLSTLSYLITNTENPRDAFLLARSALKGAARQAPPVVRALLGERVAWAAANFGDAEASRRALAEVDDEFDRRRPEDEEPDWTYWLNRDEVDVMRARCAVRLGDAVAAENVLSPVMERYPADRAREAALYRSWLAEAYARSGNAASARTTLDQVRAVAAEAGSIRLEQRVSEVEVIITDSRRTSDSHRTNHDGRNRRPS